MHNMALSNFDPNQKAGSLSFDDDAVVDIGQKFGGLSGKPIDKAIDMNEKKNSFYVAFLAHACVMQFRF